MKTISAHVTGFYRSSFHAYTTEVNVDGHRWRLGLRYSKFHDFYDQLMLQEKDFSFAFPPKGTLFFTPKPEKRQEQLEEFLQQVLAYYAAKNYPSEMEELLCELLKVPRHLKDEDDDVSTSTDSMTESVLDEPMHEPSTESLVVEKEEVETVQEEKLPVGEEKEVADVAGPVQLMTEEGGLVEETPVVHEDAEIQVENVTEVPRVSEPVQLMNEEGGLVQETPVVHEDTEIQVENVTEAPAVSEPVQLVTEESGLLEETPVVHEDAGIQMENVTEVPAATEEEEEDVKEVVGGLVPIEDATSSPEEPVEEAPIKDALIMEEAEEEAAAVTEEVAVETRLEEPVAVSAEKQKCAVQTDVLNEELMAAESLAVKEPLAVRPKKKEEHEELVTIRGKSSWAAAYLPKSLIDFLRHRCLKKSNLVVLCVALLLPMVLARK